VTLGQIAELRRLKDKKYAYFATEYIDGVTLEDVHVAISKPRRSVTHCSESVRRHLLPSRNNSFSHSPCTVLSPKWLRI
jgi:hypothetical protein